MRFWDCCGLWCDKLWMLVRVLTGGSPPPETEICQGARQDSHRQRHSQGGCSRPPPLLPACFSREIGEGGSAKPPPKRRVGCSLTGAPSVQRTQLPPPRGCRPWLGCLNLVLINSEAAAGKDFAGTGFQLHRSMAPGHGTSRAFAILSPKSKLLLSGTVEDSRHSLTSNHHGCRGKWEIETRGVKKDRKQIKRASW